MTALEAWFSSDQPAAIGGYSLRVQPHPLWKRPLEIKKGQAAVYLLISDTGSQWILKRFLVGSQPQASYVSAIAGCIPKHSAFRCGWQRQILAPEMHIPSQDGFWSNSLGTWLDGAILMPRILGVSWGDFLRKLADGVVTLSDTERLLLAIQLAGTIRLLEASNCSHRDLSFGNILVEPGDGVIHLIDWDSLFHPTLHFQHNTTLGTHGYIAPWLTSNDQSWESNADRFALAVCLAEILSVGAGSTLHGEGGLFEQQALGKDSAALSVAIAPIESLSATAAVLLRAAWHAQSFDECPSPDDWLDSLTDAFHVSADHINQGFSVTPSLQNQALAFALLRRSIQDARYADAIEAVYEAPILEQWLTAAERELIAVQRSLQMLQAALRVGNDTKIVRAVDRPSLLRSSLRPSERARLDLVLARERALADLASGVQAGNDDQTVEAWWRALHLGSVVPSQLADAAQAARHRRTSNYSPPPSPLRPPQVSPTPTPTARQYVTHLLDELARADQALTRALGMGSDAEIAVAARDVRQTGAPATNLPWDSVCAVEQRTADLDALRASLKAGTIDTTARAWAKANSLHPTAFDADLDSKGRAAFRNWGRVLRRSMRRRTSKDGS